MSSIKDRMKKNDKFIGDVLAPFEKALNMKFNKFDEPVDPKFVEPKKKPSLGKRLRQAEKKQAQLAKLKPEAAKDVLFKKAIDKAKGIKIKDDPRLIKKAIKRKEAEKNKHRKKWSERTEKLEHTKMLREKKKKNNKAKANKRKKK